MYTVLSKNLFYPLWDIKEKSIMLRTLKELERTQWLNEKELKKKQWIRLKYILHYAYSNCEYYKSLFDNQNIHPSEINEWADFARIPLLRKNDIRVNTERLISKLFKKDDLKTAKTGGSTGTSLKVYFDKQCEEIRNAAAIRSDRWAGWDLGDKRASIWGNPPISKRFRQKIRNAFIDRTMYLDTMNINEKSMNNFLDSFRKHKPTVIFGHAHSIYILAKFIQSQRITDIRPKGIISTSMMLVDNERDIIEKVFGCRVTNRYGCEEVGLIACECERHEGMHLNIDHLYIEFINDDEAPAMAGEPAAIIVTDFLNKGMPLIRYRLEDIGILSDKRCPCGRGLPLMEKVSGRVADFLVREDGSVVAGVSLVERTLTAIVGIEQMQIVQKEIDKISLNIVTDENYDQNSHEKLVNEFMDVFGKDMILQINKVEEIPQEKSGKYRFSICNVKSSYTS